MPYRLIISQEGKSLNDIQTNRYFFHLDTAKSYAEKDFLKYNLPDFEWQKEGENIKSSSLSYVRYFIEEIEFEDEEYETNLQGEILISRDSVHEAVLKSQQLPEFDVDLSQEVIDELMKTPTPSIPIYSSNSLPEYSKDEAIDILADFVNGISKDEAKAGKAFESIVYYTEF